MTIRPQTWFSIAIVVISLGVATLVVLATIPESQPVSATNATASSEVAGTQVLPGVKALPDSVQKRIDKHWQTQPADYQPRTRHFTENGAARYTNRLFLEPSPYLRQHAHNPVNWFPWGEAAFDKAKAENKPVLLSIGYSTCHWCHVMEEESFEDLEIARYMNEHYVAIKVDREERPDLDAIYMAAVQAIAGRGGWPMTVWLTPEGKPFYGGTYYPPRDGDRGVRFGFLTLLERLGNAYRQQPEQIANSSDQLVAALDQHLGQSNRGDIPGPSVLHQVVEQYKSRYDNRFGGLSSAPKFPSSLPIRLLLRYYRQTGDEQVLSMATQTLERMAAGGMYDQIGGGFHRYATDARWQIPHFEKMLYDNALLAMAYLEAYQVTGREDFARITREILRYVQRDMTAPEGGFYSATDADSPTPEGHREEGWFFTWTPEEVDQVLDEPQLTLIKRYYGITKKGNFEGRSIPHRTAELAEVAQELGLNEASARKQLEAARQALYKARERRPPPIRDEKILTAWNGLMISAFARAGLVLNEPDYTQSAVQAADYILEHSWKNGRLRRSIKDGKAYLDAYLDDYAFLTAGAMDLYEATGKVRWLKLAIDLDRTLAEHFEDRDNGGFYRTSDHHEALLVREKPHSDGPRPSGNAVAVLNLLRLGEFTTEDSYRKRAVRALETFGGDLQDRPGGMSQMLMALEFHLDQPKEVLIVTPEGQRSQAAPLMAEFSRRYLPNRIVSVVEAGAMQDRHAEVLPLLAGKKAMKGETTAYVCKLGYCKLPTPDPEVFAKQIAEVDPWAGTE